MPQSNLRTNAKRNVLTYLKVSLNLEFPWILGNFICEFCSTILSEMARIFGWLDPWKSRFYLVTSLTRNSSQFTLSSIRENQQKEVCCLRVDLLKFKINMIWIWSLLLMMNRVMAQDYTDECPTRFGFYADAVQCDRYYECKDGEVRLLLLFFWQFMILEKIHFL